MPNTNKKINTLEESKRNIDIVRRTINGAFLQSCQFLGLDFVRLEGSTLNEKLKINADQLPIPNQYPHVRYFCIGNNGHEMIPGSDGIGLISPVEHSVVNLVPFNIMPFILRDLNNDISQAERAKYGLRSIVEIRGTRYIAYYLKRLEVKNQVPTIYYNRVRDGVTESEEYEITDKNLNPVKESVTADAINVATGDYISVKTSVDIVMDENDLREYVNAANIIYGNSLYAMVTEVGIVSGYDKVLQVATPGHSPFNMNEVICAQVTTIISTVMSAAYRGSDFSISVDVGVTEPMFKLRAVDGNP